MKKHICVFLCFQNVDHIKKCFNSMKTNFTEFFIIENQSKNSDEIKEFFLNNNENIIGYYQFEKNITNNAVRIFLDKNQDLLEQYEYITISDCDLYVEDAEDTFNEILFNLSCRDVMVSCVDLSEKNRPLGEIWKTSVKNPISVTDTYIENNTGIHLMTILNKDLNLLYGTNKFLDSVFHKYVKKFGKKWVKTKRNKADHLTWELCYEGSDYIEFKKDWGRKSIWRHNEICDFTIII